jgi:hypothetical protein
MTASLLVVPRPVGLSGLCVDIAIGIASYLGSALVVNPGGIRGLLLGRLAGSGPAAKPVPPEAPPRVPV